jgi:hypothetical protein
MYFETKGEAKRTSIVFKNRGSSLKRSLASVHVLINKYIKSQITVLQQE